ncbi:hypothetical protein [Ensifer sp. LC163]|uniref:hypothetical protein n=1 Tax=Ensifer sp. LC163 TaxID=1120652 RepID=UPI0008135652|nr:hypothetical protein [Ensifer sp. LC163]OCP34876.1 hypothetical protein BC360_29625 [Ensifer sp. LC163]
MLNFPKLNETRSLKFWVTTSERSWSEARQGQGRVDRNQRPIADRICVFAIDQFSMSGYEEAMLEAKLFAIERNDDVTLAAVAPISIAVARNPASIELRPPKIDVDARLAKFGPETSRATVQQFRASPERLA